MATTNFQIFDESMTAIDTDGEYLAESQRINGVTPGLASPKMHNKLYRQCSVMAYAIANVIAARGYNANDNDPAALIDAIQRAFCFSVNGDVPGGDGAVATKRPLDAWPVGSIFLTTSSANPATLLGGGTWVRIQGQYLLASSSTYVAGNQYGAMSISLDATNIPAHTHGFTTGSAGAHVHTTSGTAASAGAHTHTVSANSAGAHTHTTSGTAASNGAHTHTVSVESAGAHTHTGSGTTGEAGSHDHTRGSMNITGRVGCFGEEGTDYSNGAFYQTNEMGKAHGGGTDYMVYMDASRNWTGATSTVANHTHEYSWTSSSAGAHVHTGTAASNGAHTHTTSGTAASAGAHTHTGSAASAGGHTHSVTGTAASAGDHTHTGTTGSTGSGAAFNIMPLSLAVNVWRRTA